jgi:hypothetical protein
MLTSVKAGYKTGKEMPKWIENREWKRETGISLGEMGPRSVTVGRPGRASMQGRSADCRAVRPITAAAHEMLDFPLDESAPSLLSIGRGLAKGHFKEIVVCAGAGLSTSAGSISQGFWVTVDRWLSAVSLRFHQASRISGLQEAACMPIFSDSNYLLRKAFLILISSDGIHFRSSP